MKKVIIIDDSATSLNLLKTTFAKNSWEVYGAQNAKIAYEMIYDVAPDIINRCYNACYGRFSAS